jgi:3-dehydroquinate dehydratase-2
MRRILLVHGPNLNLLGTREPGIYGSTTLGDIDSAVIDAARRRSAEVRCVQSNNEGAIVDAIHEARGWADGIIVNAGAYTHYSYAIADAIAAVALPAIEVHISNIHARESWRHRSVLGPVVVGSICGLGWRGYLLALDGLLSLLDPPAANVDG